MVVQVKPLNGPVGAEISGIDTSRLLTEQEFQQIEQALLHHVGIVINDLEESFDWLIDFGRRFGPLKEHILTQYHHPKTPQMSIITANMGTTESRKTSKPAGAFWHSDLSYEKDPSDAIFLYATHVPGDGGDTLVANTCMAYAALPEKTKKRIEGLTAVHRYGWNGGGAITEPDPERRALYPDVEHPVVRTHARTGKKILYVNPGFTMCIKDMDRKESDELLTELFDHLLKPEFQYRHRWKRNQLVGLDNRASMHCAIAGYQEPMRKLRMIVGCTERPGA